MRTVWEKSFADIRAMHLHPKDIGGAIVSIDQPLPAGVVALGRPRLAAASGRARRQRVVGVTVEAHDPRADGRRCGGPGCWGWPAPRRATASASGSRSTAAGSTSSPAGARGEGIAGFTLEVADSAAVQQAALAGGVPVRGEALAAFGARIELLV